MKRWLALVGLCLLGVVSTLEAHDLFLKLDSYFLTPNTRVRIRLLNGTFIWSDNAVTRDRVRDVSVVTPSGVEHPDDLEWHDRGDTTLLTLTTAGAGTYVAGLSTRPRELTLEGKDFNAYLREEGITNVLEARTRDNALGKAARERYAKHVKAIFQVGDAQSDSYSAALGYPAEIVPLENPYVLGPGDTLEVRCLVDGQPVGGQSVIAGWQKGKTRPRQTMLRTNAEGVAAVPLTARGKWFIKFVHMAPAADSSLDYESKWATVTFEVR